MAASKDPTAQRLALLCLGEIGRRADLAGAAPDAQAAVVAALERGSEEARGAASVALGGLACGDLGRRGAAGGGSTGCGAARRRLEPRGGSRAASR
jgi:hypothetical protein